MGLCNLQGIVLFVLFAIGILFVLIMAFVFRFLFRQEARDPSIMQLPSYKIPRLNNILIELIKPVSSFLKRAGGIIVAIMILLWFLSVFPSPPNNAVLPAINYSFVGILGHKLHVLFEPIGFNWQIVAALIPGMAAREVAVSALGIV